MAKDFRELLVEATRSEKWGRAFHEINVQGMFSLSVQASDCHGSIPAETLDDVYAYQAFEVQLSQKTVNFIEMPGYGAWNELSKKDWAQRFERGYIAGIMEAVEVPVEVVQQIYEDLDDYANEHVM